MEDAFPVVVVVGLAIFGMFWVGSQADASDFEFSFPGIGGEEPPERVSLYSSDPGQVGSSNEDFRTVNFGSFTIGELRGEVQAYRSQRDEIRNTLFGREEIIVDYNATQPGNGTVSFEVLGRESKGSIYVEVNDERIFEEATIAGAEPEIGIDGERFRPGMNRVVIGTTRPGILGSAMYALEDVEVSVVDRKFHDRKDYFQIYEHELEGFRPSNLTFQVPVDSSVPQEPLEIDVNGEKIYSERVGRSTQSAVMTVQNSDLRTGYNTIKFSTDGESEYRLENVESQIRYAVNVRPARIERDFSLDDQTIEYVERQDTDEKLIFNYRRNTAAAPIEIEVNNALYTVEPENGPNEVDIDEGIFQEDNTVKMRSEETFTIENLRMTSEMEE